MMVGSIFFNCWGALIAFTIYFLTTVQHGNPVKVLIGSFVTAIITFIVMFPFRLLLGYISYTPKDVQFEEMDVYSDISVGNRESNTASSTQEKYADESPEDIAKVVRDMLKDDE